MSTTEAPAAEAASTPHAQRCACGERLTDKLSRIRHAARLVSSGRLSAPQLRRIGVEIERMADWSLLETQRCDTAPAPAAGEPGLTRLSAREREVLQWLALGSSVQEIARRLSRSPKTINNHRTHVLQKLGLRNTAELTRFAIRAGLVEA